MEIVKDPASLSLILNEVREKNLSVGFVPTMGSLHSGHYSLIETAKNDSDFCVVSIFVCVCFVGCCVTLFVTL